MNVFLRILYLPTIISRIPRDMEAIDPTLIRPLPPCRSGKKADDLSAKKDYCNKSDQKQDEKEEIANRMYPGGGQAAKERKAY